MEKRRSGCSQDPEATRRVAYVSGYGPDLARYEVAPETGALSLAERVDAFAADPSFLTLDPSGTRLFAVSESMNRVGAYAIDPATGGLVFLNEVSSGGSGPAHVSVDGSGRFVLVANYGDGTIAVLPIGEGGRLGEPQQTLAVGANAHMIVTDPANRYVLVPCKGDDYVAQLELDPRTGHLAPNAVPHLRTAPGAGPRHLAFSPDGAGAYLINENDSTISALSYDAATGRLAELQTLSTLPDGAGTNTAAEVAVAPSGRFVYGSNRGDDSIATFAIDPDTRRLDLVGHVSTGGRTPRMFSIDPAGEFLYVANQGSGAVVQFAIDPETGLPAPAAAPVRATQPSFVQVVDLHAA
ncbi:MAG: lactonase family protein [Kofleriaceae bacterium]